MKTILKFDKPGKYEIKIPFEKMGEKKEWLGIVDGRDRGEYEVRVVAEHTAKETEGRVTLKAVARAGVVVKLYGLIKINKEAQNTNDFLELRVLALDKTARGFAEPELEIMANNVKASHAASVGQIDQEQMLYLMSRGMEKEKAEEVIVDAFLNEGVE